MNTRKYRWLATLFISPAILLHAAVIFIPSLSSIYYSLTKWSGLDQPVFIGLENYRNIMHDPIVGQAFMHNLQWLLMAVTIPIVFGLGIALLLKHIKAGQMFFRTSFFLPYVVSSVVIGRLFSIYYNPFGGINAIFKNMGLVALSKVDWLGDIKLALFSVFLADTWHWWGFVMVIMLSALHQVDEGLYEAAELEGANAFQKLTCVTIPQILPTLSTLITLITIWTFLTFDYVFIMTGGGPAGGTEVLSTYIYRKTFVNYEAGYGAALSVITSFVCVSIYFGFQRLQKKGWDI